MRSQILVKFTVYIFCLGFFTSSYALTLTAYSNLGSNTYVGAGGTINGSFDINSVIPGGGTYRTAYNILSATAYFTMVDEPDGAGNTTSTVSPWTVTDYGSYTYSVRYINYYVTDPVETAQISLGGQVSQVSSTWYTKVYGAPSSNYNTSCSISSGGTCYKWNTARDVTTYNLEGYGGVNHGSYNNTRATFASIIALDSAALTDLSLDGSINFSISALAGDFKLGYDRLVFELAPNPVPEPSTLILMGIGLLGLLILQRRQHKVAS